MLLPRRAAAFWEGPKVSEGGTGNAEDAKLPGAQEFIPKPCPRKGVAEMNEIIRPIFELIRGEDVSTGRLAEKCSSNGETAMLSRSRSGLPDREYEAFAGKSNGRLNPTQIGLSNPNLEIVSSRVTQFFYLG